MKVAASVDQNRPEKPLVVFDGDCGFCRFWVTRWEALTSGRFEWEPYQAAAAKFPEIPEQAFQEAVQLIQPNGTVVSGADAVLHVLASSPKWRIIVRIIERMPFVLPLVRTAYRVVARHRTLFSWLTRFAWGRHALPPTFAIARRVFAVALGAAFFAAFASLLVQVLGLYGSRGIAPASELLTAAKTQLGENAVWRIPSLFWLASSDTVLRLGCFAGMAGALTLMLGFAPGPSAVFCWALYLSFCSVGSPFLDFQWDALLLETSLLAALYLPWALRPQWATIGPVSVLGRLLLLWLLFRLMVESGAVKLASGDPTWRNLTALDYHFETQPLPLWTAWYAHYTPHWLHRLATFATFAIEFIAPLALLAPRNIRHAAAWSLIVLQVAILTTGNYAFFNWLTLALCLPLLDDTIWPKSWRSRLLKNAPVEPVRIPWLRNTTVVVAAPFVFLTGWQLVSSFNRSVSWPNWLQRFHAGVAPLRSFNSYGLFAVMTTERPEIIVEGSNDGRVWHAYGFRWKPGDLEERPKLVAPHQPRLDWQMWFAALSDVRANPWFINFMVRLLQDSPDVIALLDWNPFPNKPPRYVRAVLYDYHFSEPERSAAWWRREARAIYLPPISLQESVTTP